MFRIYAGKLHVYTQFVARLAAVRPPTPRVRGAESWQLLIASILAVYVARMLTVELYMNTGDLGRLYYKTCTTQQSRSKMPQVLSPALGSCHDPLSLVASYNGGG